MSRNTLQSQRLPSTSPTRNLCDAPLSWLLALFTLFESCFCYSGLVNGKAFLVLVLCNAWGMLDAVLRFPAVHDIDTFFSMKQLVLLVVKTLCYSLGFREISKSVGWFLMSVFGNVWAVPLLYLMALPIGDSSAQCADLGERDVDILLKMYRFCTNPSKRRQCRHSCQYRKHRAIVSLAEKFPCTRGAIAFLFPYYKSVLRKGQSV